MIDRYTLPEMGQVWTLHSRFAAMMKVEISVAEAQAQVGIIPKKAAQDIKKKSKFSVDRILELERVTKHDVIAFVSNLAEHVGQNGKFIHYGLTSSDVIDTAVSLQIQTASQLILKKIKALDHALRDQIQLHAETLCAGRTHGMHAEPTTFGMKLSGFLVELQRNEKRFKTAIKQCEIGKLSGAVGTYSAQDIEVEKIVCKNLGLTPEIIATQVIPRDRHAEVIFSISMLGAGLERLSIELRHLQRTEVGEVYEGFSEGQKGSSAMPHKKNPISAENITGVARLLRGYLVSAHENIALWHERDISHSSVERVIFPDAFIILDYALDRMARLIKGLEVNKDQMRANMELSSGHLFSSHVLLALIEKGLSREEAYKLVQKHAHGLKKGQSLQESLESDLQIMKLLNKKQLQNIFSGDRHVQKIKKLIPRALNSKLV